MQHLYFRCIYSHNVVRLSLVGLGFNPVHTTVSSLAIRDGLRHIKGGIRNRFALLCLLLWRTTSGKPGIRLYGLSWLFIHRSLLN